MDKLTDKPFKLRFSKINGDYSECRLYADNLYTNLSFDSIYKLATDCDHPFVYMELSFDPDHGTSIMFSCYSWKPDDYNGYCDDDYSMTIRVESDEDIDKYYNEFVTKTKASIERLAKQAVNTLTNPIF